MNKNCNGCTIGMEFIGRLFKQGDSMAVVIDSKVLDFCKLKGHGFNIGDRLKLKIIDHVPNSTLEKNKQRKVSKSDERQKKEEEN